MGHKAHRHALGAYAAQLISHKSRQLVGKAGWNWSDREDLEEEMVLEILRRLPRFDPSRAKRETFINRIVEHTVCDMIEKRKAQMRDYRRCRKSLQDLVQDEGGEAIEFGETLSGEAIERRTGTPDLDEDERRDLRIELGPVLGRLPPHLRELARRLVRSSPSEIARVTGTPRTTLLKRIEVIRGHFQRVGLAEYLPREASD